MSGEKIGTSKTSYHNSGSINRDTESPNSGKYENTGGKEKWHVDEKHYTKDNAGNWLDKDGKTPNGR